MEPAEEQEILHLLRTFEQIAREHKRIPTERQSEWQNVVLGVKRLHSFLVQSDDAGECGTFPAKRVCRLPEHEGPLAAMPPEISRRIFAMLPHKSKFAALLSSKRVFFFTCNDLRPRVQPFVSTTREMKELPGILQHELCNPRVVDHSVLQIHRLSMAMTKDVRAFAGAIRPFDTVLLCSVFGGRLRDCGLWNNLTEALSLCDPQPRIFFGSSLAGTPTLCGAAYEKHIVFPMRIYFLKPGIPEKTSLHILTSSYIAQEVFVILRVSSKGHVSPAPGCKDFDFENLLECMRSPQVRCHRIIVCLALNVDGDVDPRDPQKAETSFLKSVWDTLKETAAKVCDVILDTGCVQRCMDDMPLRHVRLDPPTRTHLAQKLGCVSVICVNWNWDRFPIRVPCYTLPGAVGLKSVDVHRCERNHVVALGQNSA